METNRSRYFDAPEIRKVDEDSRVIEFVASDGSVDSYKTVLPPDNWELKRYNKNGVVFYQHDGYGNSDPDSVIAKGRAFVEDGKLILSAEFEPADLNERADKIFRKIKFGSIKAVSVGFSGKGHYGDKARGEDPAVYYYDRMELLEVSVVNIPANANAVKRSMEAELADIALQKPAPSEPKRNSVNVESTLARAIYQLAKK